MLPSKRGPPFVEVPGRLPTRLQRHRAARFSARHPFEAVQLGNEPFVRRGPTGSRQGAAVPVGIDKKVYAKLPQGD